MPLFAGMPSSAHWPAILDCGRATAGDVVITLVAFWTIAAATGSRTWILHPTCRQGLGYPE